MSPTRRKKPSTIQRKVCKTSFRPGSQRDALSPLSFRKDLTCQLSVRDTWNFRIRTLYLDYKSALWFRRQDHSSSGFRRKLFHPALKLWGIVETRYRVRCVFVLQPWLLWMAWWRGKSQIRDKGGSSELCGFILERELFYFLSTEVVFFIKFF